MRGRTAVVLCGPAPPSGGVGADLPSDALVIAADVGYHHAATLGLRVDRLVGDLDSISESDLAAARAAGVVIEQQPSDKDATDLELAIEAALAMGASDVVVIDGGVGPRVDHFLANALLLANDRWRSVSVRGRLGGAAVAVARAGAAVELVGVVGSIVSVLPIGGPVELAASHGLRWPLAGLRLEPGTTHGISNELTSSPARVEVHTGTALLVQPEVW